MNFQAGILKRAPVMLRALGFEWLWRIKEERYLWNATGTMVLSYYDYF